MRKIVINACFGGFGLSEAGMQHYAKLKGLTLYPEVDKDYPALLGCSYWLVPPEQRRVPQDGEFYGLTLEETRALTAAYAAQTLADSDIARDDPVLVQVVEELGTAANGKHAELKVVEIPDDVLWGIDGYDDGSETVREQHRSWS